MTGASSGIGAELARIFAAAGHPLVLVARSEERLDAIADDIAASSGTRPVVLPCDLARPERVAALADDLAARGLKPAILVNNAGFGLVGEAAALDRAEQLDMIDLNVRALVDLTLRLLPGVVRQQGGVLNVASVAAFLPGPGMAVYYASKAFVLSFSEALTQELAGTGAHVTTLCPGPVPTGFQKRAGVASPQPAWFIRSAERVARAGYDGFLARRRVVVPGFANRLTTLAGRLPHGLLLPLAQRFQRRRRPHD